MLRANGIRKGRSYKRYLDAATASCERIPRSSKSRFTGECSAGASNLLNVTDTACRSVSKENTSAFVDVERQQNAINDSSVLAAPTSQTAPLEMDDSDVDGLIVEVTGSSDEDRDSEEEVLPNAKSPRTLPVLDEGRCPCSHNRLCD